MRNLSNIITRIKKPKTRMSIVMMILVFGFCTQTFAQNTSDTQGMEKIAEGLDTFIKLCSRLRIILAGLAGKVMTNDRVYGSVFHMDQYLWNLWNICKNFANFGLLALMLVGIFKHLFSKGDSPAKIIQKVLITGILIQASWFLLGAVLDIATIATQTIASFPNSYISSTDRGKNANSEIDKTMKSYNITIGENNATTSKTPQSTTTITESDRKDISFSKILPKYDSLGGPLMFIGLSALRIQDYMDLAANTDLSAKNMSINFALKSMILILFVLTMVFLIVANVMRMGYLWIVIPLSPIFILLRTMGKDMMGKSKDSLFAKLNASTVLLMIFKPVIFAAVISLILLFVVTMQQIMMKQGDGTLFDHKGMAITTRGNESIYSDPNSSLSITDTTFKSTTNGTQNLFANIILSFSTLFLMWILIKVAITSGGGPIEDAMKGMTKWTENAAQTIPILPGGYSRNASGKATESFTKGLTEATGINLNSNDIYGFGQQTKALSSFEDNLKKAWGMNKGINASDRTEFRDFSTKKDTKFLDKTKEMISPTGGTTLSIGENSQRKTLFEAWLKIQTQDSLKKAGFEEDSDTESLEKFFAKKDNIKAFHKFITGKETGAPETYENLLKYKYGKQ